MARDLTRERGAHRNGSDVTQAVDALLSDSERPPVPDPDPVPEPEPAPELPERLEVRRDKLTSRIALVMIDVAKILDPLTRIVMARLLALASLGAAVGICVYTISRTDGWQRVATAGLFVCLASWLIRKGQG